MPGTMRLAAALLFLVGLTACGPRPQAAPSPAATAAPAPVPAAAQTEASLEVARDLTFVKLPAGFRIEMFAADLPGARSLARAEGGTIFVGTRERRVYAIADRDGDGRAEFRKVLTEDLSVPNGVAVRDGSLYVAEISRILRYDDIEKRLEAPGTPVVITEDLPKDRSHGWKFIAFGPDGLLYVPVGAPCNVCEREDPRYAALLRMKPDGSGQEVFASGIRNTVGFDWDASGVLWFTDNGRDMMGDDLPADELNRAPRKGMHFGFPYVHQGDLPDPEFGRGRDVASFAAPAMKLGPHVAALGMRFYDGKMFPEEYRGDIFIAEHGSWNRSKPIGYRVTRVQVEGGVAKSYSVFAEGWLREGDPRGRPVDVLVLPDGSLLVSDDSAGCVYRISYRP